MKLLDLIEKRVSMPSPDAPVKNARNDLDLLNILVDRGWRYLGSGSFGSVFAKPNSQEVFKFFRDPAYLRFLAFTKMSDNPHFPNTGKPFRLNFGHVPANPIRPSRQPWYGWYGVTIERLVDDTAIGPYVSYFLAGDYLETNRSESAIKIDQKFPQFRQACLDIVKLVRSTQRKYPDMGFDHDVDYGKNMMMRGDCPVFTDPVYQQG